MQYKFELHQGQLIHQKLKLKYLNLQLLKELLLNYQNYAGRNPPHQFPTPEDVDTNNNHLSI